MFEGRLYTEQLLFQLTCFVIKLMCFCFRRDNQIKIQGQRMEPGEVEAVITSTEDVSGCVVLLIKPVQVINNFTAHSSY